MIKEKIIVNNKSDFKNFTLIELLVVVAIIGILMTMLMPQLSRARKAGKTAVSINNLKQNYIAIITYADSNDGIICKPSGNPHPYTADAGANYNRLIYENITGELLPDNHGDCKEKMAESAYVKMMFCPVIRDLRGPVNQHGQGRGDYSINRYFQFDYRKISIAMAGGKEEPFMVPGTAMPSTQATSSFSHGTYDPTNTGRPAYVYTNQRTLTLFINGGVSFMSMAVGESLDAQINNRNYFD